MTRERFVCLGVGLVLLLAIDRPASAYRTAADLPEFAGTGRVRWPVDTIHHELATWLPPGLDLTTAQQAVAAGFAAWTDLSCPIVTFVDEGVTLSVAVPGDGRVTVQWISQDWTARGFDPTAAASTEVLYDQEPSGLWRITDADIYLNADLFTWSTAGTDPTTRDVQAVVTHEIGHVLGLLHPCEPDGSEGAPLCGPEHADLCMNPEYSLTQRALAPDDVAGACFLYTPPECATAGCPGDQTCTPEGCSALCDGSLCAPGDRCGPIGCTSDPCPIGSCERGCDDTCQTPGGADGDPCAADLDCYSGHCNAASYCAPLCSEGMCAEGFLCDQEASPPECSALEGVLGAACGSGSECLSGQCLIENDIPKVCTRVCGDDARACPDGFSCAPVDGVEVCVPPDEGGCATAPRRRGSGAILFLLFASVLVARRIRRRGFSC